MTAPTGFPGGGAVTVAAAGGRSRGGRPRLGFGLRGPRRPRHVLAIEQLAAVGLPVGDDGVVIGVDNTGRPAVLGVNRPTPLDVVLIGGIWTAQVIALRTAATGARVAVETARPQLWTPLAQAAGGGQPCVTVYDVGRVPPQGASVGSPVLVVRDAGVRPPRGRVAAAPWQSVLTLLPYLGPTAPRLLEGASLVGVQRVSPDEARLVGRLMRLPERDAEALPGLGDQFALWCTRQHRQFVMTRPTEAESGLLGGPRRVD
ncbi:hypothetical protein ABZ832_30395 [Streptantibioticus parmotrematis]|uniref:hypothetical protein n=1 Tax=Streptantibioticus parmotrematis TaxID=2873249 RepID=UPI0033EE19EB